MLCQQVQPLVPSPIGPYGPGGPGIRPYVPGGPGTVPYVPGGTGTGQYVPGGPDTGPYVPYLPYGPDPRVPAISVPQPPDHSGTYVVPPLRIIPGMIQHQVGVKNTYPLSRPDFSKYPKPRPKLNPNKSKIFQNTD